MRCGLHDAGVFGFPIISPTDVPLVSGEVNTAHVRRRSRRGGDYEYHFRSPSGFHTQPSPIKCRVARNVPFFVPRGTTCIGYANHTMVVVDGDMLEAVQVYVNAAFTMVTSVV